MIARAGEFHALPREIAETARTSRAGRRLGAFVARMPALADTMRLL